MTREEAIEILGDLDGYFSDNQGRDYDEAFRMAIEALHREEAEANGWCHRIRPKDVEVVVRCKDCKWWNSETKGCKRNPSVEAWHETDFCNHGEKT